MPDLTFGASDSWLCPPGWTRTLVECLGGGGAGNPYVPGLRPGGGGSGGYLSYSIVPTTPGVTYAITVGGGGIASLVSGMGTGGGSSIFGDNLVLGPGGFPATAGDGGGIPVVAPIGDNVVNGLGGSPGSNITGFGGDGGAGAPPYGGLGGAGTSGGTAGNGLSPGGGGGGAGFGGIAGNGAGGLVYLTRVSSPVVRLFPRDDGRGMSSAPRIIPFPKGRSRIIGGYQ